MEPGLSFVRDYVTEDRDFLRRKVKELQAIVHALEEELRQYKRIVHRPPEDRALKPKAKLPDETI